MEGVLHSTQKHVKYKITLSISVVICSLNDLGRTWKDKSALFIMFKVLKICLLLFSLFFNYLKII